MSLNAADERESYTYPLTNFTSVRAFVLFASCLFLLSRYVLRAVKYRADTSFGKLNGCKPPTFVLSYKWPLALDIVKRGFRAGRQKKLLSFFTEYFDQLGPTIELTIFGGTSFATMEPENVEAILSTRFDGVSSPKKPIFFLPEIHPNPKAIPDFHLRPRNKAMVAMTGEGIFSQDGPAWKHSRELLRRQFVRMQYQNLEGFREHVENLVEVVSNSPGIVDLQPHFYRLTLNTTIAMILGQSVESFNHEKGELFSSAFNKASLVTATRVRLGDLYFLYAPKGFFTACRSVKAYTDELVRDVLQQRRGTTETSNKYNFINELQKEHQDVRLVRDQVINVLIAGRDTTAATMSYAFRLLVRYPHTLKKLRAEVESVLGQDKDITRAYIQRMPYLQHVLKETLRLYPPVPINTRFCKRATTLPVGGGPDGRAPLLVREGMPVAYSVYHMQRRKDLYGSDAGSFRPERWEGPELADIKWGYLPFNGGPRLCLGKDFGLMLASYGIARMIQAFPNIELPPGEAWEEPGAERQHLTLTLSNAGGCKVLLT